MTTNDVAELVSWLRKQMAADETKIRGVMYSARHADQGASLETIEMLAQLERDRARLDDMGSDELRELGLLYADREGYQESWRP